VGGWVGGKKVSLRTTSQLCWDVVKNRHDAQHWNTVVNTVRVPTCNNRFLKTGQCDLFLGMQLFT
jgi:hypothetical protein